MDILDKIGAKSLACWRRWFGIPHLYWARRTVMEDYFGAHSMLASQARFTPYPQWTPDWHRSALPYHSQPQRSQYVPRSTVAPPPLLQFGIWSRGMGIKEQLEGKWLHSLFFTTAHLLYMILYVPRKCSHFRALKTNETFISVTFIL